MEEPVTPYRHWAKTPEGTRIYAIGDIHGRFDLLEEVHGMIRADMAHHDAKRTVVVYLGDYIDRGPHSREVIDRLLGHPIPNAEHVHLRGNHEEVMLQFLDLGTHGVQWLTHGAGAMFESYGVAAPLPTEEADFPFAREALS